MNQPFPTADPYATLGVKADASADEIKAEYRKLAKKLHPDRSGGDKKKEAQFKEVTAAYDVLGDKNKRAQYDAYRRGPQMPHGSAAAGFDFSDLFAQMFGGAQGASAGGNGRRVEYHFGGGGGSPFGGGGSPFGGGFQQPGFSADAYRQTRTRPRPAAPPVKRERNVKAKDGSPLLQKGANIYSDVHLQLDQALLGTVSEVSTLEGSASVKMPPGTSSGVKLRLKGKGARKSNGGRGDHYVTVQIDVPKKLDRKGQELLTKLMTHVRKS